MKFINHKLFSASSYKKEEKKMSIKRIFQLAFIFIVMSFSLASAHNVYASAYCPHNYVVQTGDWLSKIANRCGITLSQLYAANPSVGHYIYPGQVLVIPGGYIQGSSYCGPKYSSRYGYYYVACHGDTLGKIARYYGVSVSYLQYHNGIANRNLIYVGQIIWR